MRYKILHIFSSYSFGGAEKTTLLLAENLQKSGVCDNIVAVPYESQMSKEALKRNIKIVTFKAVNSFDPCGILKLVKIIKRNNINILHVHQGKLYWTSLIVKFLCLNKIKVVFHRRQDTRHSFISKNHYKFADAIITVSQAVANGLIKYEKVDPKKIMVVYNGVNFEKFNKNIDYSDVIKKYSLENKKVVGTVSQIVDFKGKGQTYLMEAAKMLREEFPDLRYLIVGSGKGLQEQQAYAKKLNVDDIVCFTGYQDDVPKYILAMDIFCLLAWDTEGMPNVVVEAQSLEKPVVVTNIGGNSEAFVDGVTGFMVEPKNSIQVANAIKKLILNPHIAKQMGIEGKKFVEKKFVLNNTIKNVLEVYKGLSKKP
ncbi:MAG: glycosyltransferase family 4 protein [Endomicrobium sp.]|jgi:glycosyltransferase involved in cell wall biosynthesis|uniref:glycosyltransferase family 4 protein n=1 Tax=Candidatus Endomicrobiellum cubanum TaxID=3242325 RepID=UPI0028302572|nr:glycosyltransferase family 4 protein [Endomicrobium sp.]